jgi:hypothetical protein
MATLTRIICITFILFGASSGVRAQCGPNCVVGGTESIQGGGYAQCPSTIKITDSYPSVTNYNSACKFTCTANEYNSLYYTFAAGSCASTVAFVGGVGGVQSQVTGTFHSSGCTSRGVAVLTTVTDQYGTIQTYQGKTIGYICRDNTNGFGC